MTVGPTVASQERLDPRGFYNTGLQNNPQWTRRAIAEGLLNAGALSGATGTVVRTESATRTGTTPLGSGARTSKQFTINPALPRFIPNPRFTAESSAEGTGNGINGGTELVEGIPLGTFIGGTTGTVNSNTLPQNVVSSLYLYLTVQAEILKAARSRPEFLGYRIVVEEGVYSYQPTETETEGDLAQLMSRGRAIGYAVKTIHGGTTSIEKTFQLAEYLVGYPFYEKIIMNYNNFYSGRNDVGVCVFVVLPELDESYNGNWSRQKETRVNGRVQSQSIMMLTGV